MSKVHGGYNLLQDSRPNHQGTEIDGRVIKSANVVRDGKLVGYRPNCSSLEVNLFSILNFKSKTKNSDYMSNYLETFGEQIKTWLRTDCIRPHRPEYESAQDLGSVHVHKTTIEPEKPRICLK